MSFPKRVQIADGAEDYRRSFRSSFQLSCRSSVVSYGFAPKDADLVRDHGEQGKNLWRALEQIDGIDWNLAGYYLGVRKVGGLKWKEVEPLVLKALRDVHGDFEVVRENVVVRLCYILRRNVFEILFPHWYK